MNVPDLVCTHCGRKNSYFQFWCKGCHAALPQPAQPSSFDASLPSEQARKQLYDRVLSDLEQLVESNEVPPEQSEAIQDFYGMRLRQIEGREAKRVQVLAIDKLIRTARGVVQGGHYRQAVQILQAGIKEYPAAFPAEQMLEELRRKHAEELAARNAREAIELLSQARRLQLLGHFDQAQSRLLRASELNPGNQAVQAALAELNATIAAERSKVEAASTPASDQAIPISHQVDEPIGEEIVMASLVEPDEVLHEVLPIDAVLVEPIDVPAIAAPPAGFGGPEP